LIGVFSILLPVKIPQKPQKKRKTKHL
jgi:hypothetical protein